MRKVLYNSDKPGKFEELQEETKHYHSPVAIMFEQSTIETAEAKIRSGNYDAIFVSAAGFKTTQASRRLAQDIKDRHIPFNGTIVWGSIAQDIQRQLMSIGVTDFCRPTPTDLVPFLQRLWD